MHRPFFALVLFLALLTPAAAGLSTPRTEKEVVKGPGAGTTETPPGLPVGPFGVGPGGLVGPGSPNPYYLTVTLDEPELPHGGNAAADDCADGQRPADQPSAAEGLVLPGLGIVLSDPTAVHSLVGITPTCAATGSDCALLPCPAYASYNATSGRYYVEGPPVPLGPLVRLGLDLFPVTGTTGVATSEDCETCPPPVCCP